MADLRQPLRLPWGPRRWRTADRGRGASAAAVAGGAFAVLVVAAILYLARVPAAWGLLAVCALATLPIVVRALVTGRLLEPLSVLATATALMFVMRPLQLFLGWRELYSHFFPEDPGRRLVLLEGQEVAAFVTHRLGGALQPAMTRAVGACALFLVTLLVGYRLELGAWLSRGVSRLRTRRRPRLGGAVGLSLAIGLTAQALVVVRAGGPAESLKGAADQTALADSFVLFVLTGFAFAGLVVWVAWRRPQRPLEWTALGLSLAATCGLSLLSGSRGRLFLILFALAVVRNYCWKPWRTRELVAAAAAMLVFVTGFLAFREYADVDSLSTAASESPRFLLDERVFLNDDTSFDHVLYATAIYGRTRDHEQGAFLLGGARSFVPRAIDPGKPEGGDIVFRKAVWQNRFGAGRPPTAVGDLYIDFGYVGVALGGLLIGVLARALLGLVRGPASGREYRVALYAVLLIVLCVLVAGTFSLAIGHALTLLLPLLIAVHGFGRLPIGRAAEASG
jgi:oligosaccharide repeat unit polymerase